MSIVRSKIQTGLSKLNNNDSNIFFKYLSNHLFRGFYYDSDERCYGIVLSFPQEQPESFDLYAQESKAGKTSVEYKIHSNMFYTEQTAYDKVLISSSFHIEELLSVDGKNPKIPENVEFTIQVLTRNSIYLRFLNPELYTSPISSFKGGLVLSRENSYSMRKNRKIQVEAGEIF